MAIAYDAVAIPANALYAATFIWTHTPVGTPKGVAVIVVQETSADQVSGVTYGGVAMTRVRSDVRTVTEPGRVYIYFLGASIPTGAQTVQVTLSGTADTNAVSLTVTAATVVTAVDVSNGLDAGIIANPSLSISPTVAAVIFYGIFSGLAAPVTTVETGSTHVAGKDYGTDSAMWARKSVAAGGATTIGYTAASDDVCHSALAIIESTLTAIGDEVQKIWNIRQAVPDTSQSIWNVRFALGDTNQYIYHIRGLATDTVQYIWSVKSAIGDTIQNIWHTRFALGKPVQLVHNVLTTIGDTSQYIWNVLSSVTAVGDIVELAWHIRQAINKTSQSLWNVRAIISDTVQSIWNVATSVSDTIQNIWHTRVLATQTRQMIWNVLANVYTAWDALQLIWNIRIRRLYFENVKCTTQDLNITTVLKRGVIIEGTQKKNLHITGTLMGG